MWLRGTVDHLVVALIACFTQRLNQQLYIRTVNPLILAVQRSPSPALKKRILIANTRHTSDYQLHNTVSTPPTDIGMKSLKKKTTLTPKGTYLRMRYLKHTIMWDVMKVVACLFAE